jgi:hypothetical protein
MSIANLRVPNTRGRPRIRSADDDLRADLSIADMHKYLPEMN